jgi:hypothetical protein
MGTMTSVRPACRPGVKAVPALLEPPPTHRTARPPAPASVVIAVDDETGIVEALVAVTGVVDDVIEPGAFVRTLRTRTPAMVLGHDWNRQ